MLLRRAAQAEKLGMKIEEFLIKEIEGDDGKKLLKNSIKDLS